MDWSRTRTSVTLVFAFQLVLAAVTNCSRADESAITAVASANAAGRVVGDLGDTRKLQFEGLQRFTPVQVRGKLECDLRYQAAARPSGDLEQFLRVLEERLVAGYRYCGCPEAKVRAGCDEQSSVVRVQVEEGQQYRKAQIEIAAPQQVNRDAIVRDLTTLPQTHEWRIERDGVDLAKPKEGEIVWKIGDPVHYDEVSIAELNAAVRRSLAEQGFARAKFGVHLSATDNSGNVNLQVQVDEAAAPDRITGIEVVGLRRNSRDELLQFLHVAEGDALNSALLERVYKQLEDCCRFWTYKVSAAIPPEKPNQDSLIAAVGNVLKIELDEYTEVPPLGKPFADVDEVLRKAGLLLASTVKSQDLVVEASGLQDATEGIKAVRAVVGCDGRACVEALSAAKSAWDIDHALLVSPGALEIYDWKAQQKYVSPLPASMTFHLNIKPTRGEQGEYTMSAVVGGAAKGVDSEAAASEGPWQIKIAPVAVVHLAHRKDAKRPKMSIRGGEFTYSDGHVNLRLDAETGRLKELRCAAGNWIKKDFLFARLAPGAFDKTAGTMRAKGQSFQNYYDERHKIASGFDFTLAQIEKQPLVQKTPELVMYCRIVHQLRASQTLATLWSRWLELAGEDPATFGVAKADRCRDFKIPAASSKKDDEIAATIDNGLVGVPAMADLMFARGTWPWTISREACFWELREQLCAGQTEQASALAANEFRRMASGQVGPLGALALAQSVKQLESADGRHVNTIGNWGLAMMSQEAFLQDVKLTTDGDSGLALVCRAATEQLGKMTEEEQAAVIELLPDGLQGTAERIAKRRREQPNESPGQTIQAALLESWNGGLREVVQAELHEVATEVAKKSDEKTSLK